MALNTPLIAVGVVPPPLTGKSEVTRQIFTRLEASAGHEVFFVKASIAKRGWNSIPVRIKMAWAILRLVVSLLVRGERAPVYLVAEGGPAIILTIIHSAFLRLVASPLVIHHHGRYWLERPNPLLKALLFNQSAVHVMQCSAMSDMAHRAYGLLQTITLTNAFLICTPPQLAKSQGDSGVMRLAHLSNLTMEKGLGRVIATFETLKRQGVDVQLRLGGSCQDKETERVLSEALKKHTEIDWRGHVTVADKDAFFEGVDAFLFPTLYEMETEGIVTLEAMARGIPVLATDLCCLKENLADSGGFAIPASCDFPSQAAVILSGWQNDPELLLAARKAALQRFATIRACSETELSALFALLGGGVSAPPITTDPPAAEPTMD